MSGRHRFTKAGLKQENADLRQRLRDEQTKYGRLADDLTQFQQDRRQDNEQAARQHQIDSQEIRRLQDALRAWQARWDNAHPIHVPAPRDLRASDERPTVPTDVSSLRAIVPVVPIPERPKFPITENQAGPDATNPANIPAA